MLCCSLSIPLLVCILAVQSYAKNMGLYGERIGSLTVITSDPKTTKKVDSQLKSVSTLIYSNLPASHVSFMHLALVPVHWPRMLPCRFVLPLNECCVLSSIE